MTAKRARKSADAAGGKRSDADDLTKSENTVPTAPPETGAVVAPVWERAVRRLAAVFRLTDLKDTPRRDVLMWGCGMAVAAMLVRALYILLVRRTWEDALITCLHTENFAMGYGLTHVRPGEPPLHGFTSPLSVLVPLPADLLHPGWGVEFIKWVSVPVSGLTVLAVLAIGLRLGGGLSLPALIMAAGYAALDHHQILWAASGMETQLVVASLMFSMYYAMTWQPVPLGLSLGICMLARPDMAFWTVIAGLCGLAVRARWKSLLTRVVPLAVAVYGPWILFTLLYYGSPVPHTIIAKGLGYPSVTKPLRHSPPWTWIWFGIQRFLWKVQPMLAPSYSGHGTTVDVWPSINGYLSPFGALMCLLALAGAAWLVRARKWEALPLVAYVLVYTGYFMYLVSIVFGWYKPPLLMAIVLLGAAGLDTVARRLKSEENASLLRWGLALGWLVPIVAIMPLNAYTDHQVQRYVEDDIRTRAGLWLRERMKPDEAVGAEPLGYLGYYSRGNVYDWPGLNSRVVVAWSKANPGRRSLENMLRDLKPEYLFLRDLEYLYSFRDVEWLRREYHPVAAFSMSDEVAGRIRWIRSSIDTQYRIYKRNRPEDPQPYDESLWPVAPPVSLRQAGYILDMGKRLLAQRRTREAKAHFERALQFDPRNAEARQLLESLDRNAPISANVGAPSPITLDDLLRRMR